MVDAEPFPRGQITKTYAQKSIRDRLEAFLLDNVGKVVTRDQLLEVAKDPTTGEEPENWHQRISELRTDSGYRILSHRDDRRIAVSEYLLASTAKSPVFNKRVRPTPAVWAAVLDRAGGACEWEEDGIRCELKEGDTDPIGGGTVHLTPDHSNPHSLQAGADPQDPLQWRALCGRHQVMKKNFWDSTTGRINYIGIVQAARVEDKQAIFDFLKTYFGNPDGKEP
ncbi:MAG: restriction endonuclease [Thermoplasmata archaeon]